MDLLLGAGRFVLARNWRGGGGELDIVALHDGKLRFIEVRAWSEADRDGLSSLTANKQRRLHRAAEAFLAAILRLSLNLALKSGADRLLRSK